MPDTKPETAQVDPSATRRRLASFASGEPYKPELLARLARLSVELGEPAQAGRFWLLSDAAGPDVDAAVETFVQSCDRVPRLIASQLPRFVRDWHLPQYAGPALARIEKYGLKGELSRRAPPEERRGSPRMTAVAAAVAVALLILVAALLVFRR